MSIPKLRNKAVYLASSLFRIAVKIYSHANQNKLLFILICKNKIIILQAKF
jgi:hypothetical protein